MKIKQARHQLDNIRSKPSWSAVEEAKIEFELDKLLAQEEKYRKTRSRAGWLMEGDRTLLTFIGRCLNGKIRTLLILLLRMALRLQIILILICNSSSNSSFFCKKVCLINLLQRMKGYL